MISKVNNLILDNILFDDQVLSAANGLVIKKCLQTEVIPIASIYWDDLTESCYIETIKNHLQDYIVSYDDYKDFIKLVDEAFYTISLLNKPELEGKI